MQASMLLDCVGELLMRNNVKNVNLFKTIDVKIFLIYEVASRSCLVNTLKS